MFDKLKSFVFETPAAVEGEEAPTPPSKTVKVPRSTPPPILRVGRTSVAAGATVDSKIRAILDKDVEVAAKPAYSEFAAVARSMEGAVPDETQRMKAALAIISSKGMDADAVIFDIDECVAKLKEKSVAAQKAVEQAKNSAVTPRQKEIQTLRTEGDRITHRLAEITLRETLLAKEIEEETALIDKNAEELAVAVESYLAELLDRKEKIAAL